MKNFSHSYLIDSTIQARFALPWKSHAAGGPCAFHYVITVIHKPWEFSTFTYHCFSFRYVEIQILSHLTYLTVEPTSITLNLCQWHSVALITDTRQWITIRVVLVLLVSQKFSQLLRSSRSDSGIGNGRVAVPTSRHSPFSGRKMNGYIVPLI